MYMGTFFIVSCVSFAFSFYQIKKEEKLNGIKEYKPCHNLHRGCELFQYS